MMTCTHGYAHLVKECSYIVRMGSLYIEGDDTSFAIKIMGTLDGDAAHALDLLMGILQQVVLMSTNISHT